MRLLAIVIFFALFNQSFGYNKHTADSIKLVIKSSRPDSNRVNSLIKLSWQYYLSNADTCIILCRQAEEIAEAIDYKYGMSEAYGWLGYLLRQKGQMVHAIEYNQKALVLYKETGDHSGVASTLNNIGNIYDDQADLTTALEYYEKAITVAKTHNLTEKIAIYMINVSGIYKKLKNYQKALEYSQMSLKVAKLHKYERGIASAHEYNATAYIKLGSPEMATKELLLAITLFEKLNADRGLHGCFLRLSQLYKSDKKLQEAKMFGMKAYSLASKIKDPVSIKIAAKNMSTVYVLLKEWDKAYHMMNTYHEKKDSIASKENSKALISFEFKTKALEDSLLRAESDKIKELEYQQELAKENMISTFSIIGA